MTNMAAGVLDCKLTDEEVGIAAAKIADRFADYIKKIISNI